MKIEIINSKQIGVFEEWNPRSNVKLESIPGGKAKFSEGDFNCWSFPLNFETCLRIREQFKDAAVGAKLRKWARAERERRQAISQILLKNSINLPRVEMIAPNLFDAISSREYQTVGAGFLCVARNAIIADQPGLGKTLQIISAIIQNGCSGKVLVVAPTTAVSITWPEELNKWLPDEPVFVIEGTRAQRNKCIVEAFNCKAKRIWILVNYESLRSSIHPGKLFNEQSLIKWSKVVNKKKTSGLWHHSYSMLFETSYCAVVADESHKVMITKTPIKTRQTYARAGMALLKVNPGGMRIAASGTPLRGKVDNLWGTLNWIRPDRYRSYTMWVNSWFEVFSDDGIGFLVGDIKSKELKRFNEEMLTIMIRRTKEEVAPDLPPKIIIDNWLEMRGKQKIAYEQMRKNGEALLESGNLMGNGILEEILRLKQFASSYGDVGVNGYIPSLPSNKFEWLLNFLQERQNSGIKTVVASQFTKLINLFSLELTKAGISNLQITGKTSLDNRKSNKTIFQGEGGPLVFLLNTIAGGTSLTLDAADDIVVLDDTWVPDDQEQVIDRVHRVSRIHQVTVYRVRSKGSIEERILRRTDGLDVVQKQLLDGRRGVELAKQLFMA